VIDSWITAGAGRIIIHAESTQKMDEIVKMMNGRFYYEGMTGKRDVELGIALNLDTPTDVVLPYLEDIQCVQFMGIQIIGQQGQPFEERVLDKIRDFHNAHPEITINVDGGVNFDTAPLLIEAGAKRLIAGSAVFEGNVSDNIHAFKNLIGQ
jgi:ribulose-phosphate 3-epimerase